MTPSDIVQIVLASLEIAARAAPGFLAAFSGAGSDADAIERARKALAEIPTDPAKRGIDAWRARLEV